MGKLESYNGVASAILGQSEVFLSPSKGTAFLNRKAPVLDECFRNVHSFNVHRWFLYGID